jgi:hypothetical protein
MAKRNCQRTRVCDDEPNILAPPEVSAWHTGAHRVEFALAVRNVASLIDSDDSYHRSVQVHETERCHLSQIAAYAKEKDEQQSGCTAGSYDLALPNICMRVDTTGQEVICEDIKFGGGWTYWTYRTMVALPTVTSLNFTSCPTGGT